MLPKSHPRPLTFQLTLTVLALAALALSMAAGFGLFAIGQTDEDSLRKQRIFVANGLAEQVEALKREQESITVWDDSVVNIKAGNRQWMIENLGEWMHSYYGHDRVYVLDDRDRPVYAMQDGETVASSAYAVDEPAVLPKLGELRILMRQIADGVFEEPPKAVEAGFVSLDGRPAILSIMPIVPDTDRVQQEPGSEYVHVSLKYIDEEVVGAIARQYLLSGAHLASSLAVPVARAAIPLVGENGAILGYIAWDQDKPGMSVLGKAAPALAAAALLAALVLAYLLRRRRRASAQLQSSQDEAQYLAFHDTLTRLPNRALFEDRLKRALVSTHRENGAVALLYIDLDRFKHVNDTLGHPAGDELVKQAGLAWNPASARSIPWHDSAAMSLPSCWSASRTCMSPRTWPTSWFGRSLSPSC
jgi:sensor domain CHASE-containing protein